jgi:hypothetical protein
VTSDEANNLAHPPDDEGAVQRSEIRLLTSAPGLGRVKTIFGRALAQY